MSAGTVLSAWEGNAVEAWRARWRLPRIVALSETGSTNDVARTLAASGAPAGLLVMSEHQSAGRGRMRRHWADTPGRSLLLSFLLRPTGGSGEIAAGTAPLRVGMALARSLRETGIDARLKWPNDVVADGRKLAGILCEAVSAGADTVIIAGIGINVLQQPHDWPDELRDQATSMARILGDAVPSRAAVMDAVTRTMLPLFTSPLVPLSRDELLAYETLDALRGLAVTAVGAEHAHGTAAGIAADGALLIRAPDGLRRITSATVRVSGGRTTPVLRTGR